MNRRSVLITGVTGIMGSWVLGEALRRGYTPVALMRDASLDGARDRLASVLRLVGQENRLDRVEIIHGDTRQPNLGLTKGACLRLRGSLTAMVHCAACTSFEPRLDQELWDTNVEGVRNVIGFLRGSGIPLYHVSTAYVVGDRAGLAYEDDLDCGQHFNNTYERTKYESELLVREAIAAGWIRAAIFRPAIIVGATREGRISQFLNFYSVLRLVEMMSLRPSSERRRLRILATPEVTKNLVPVDWTAQALWTIVEAEGASGLTYHLTNPAPSVLGDIAGWANGWLEPYQTQVELVADYYGEKANTLERVINASLRYYRPYTRGEIAFDRTNTDRVLGSLLPFPEVNDAHLDKMLGFARQQCWQGIFGCGPNGRRDLTGGRITRFFPRLAEPPVTSECPPVADEDEDLAVVK